jgi:hypothetical protein
MAGPCHHTVRIVGLHHDNAEGEIIAEQDLPCLLRRHALILSGFVEQFHIMIQLIAVFRIDNLNAVQLDFKPGSAVHDLLLVPDHDNIRYPFLHDVGRCNQSPLIRSFRQNNRFSVRPCLVLNHVNV